MSQAQHSALTEVNEDILAKSCAKRIRGCTFALYDLSHGGQCKGSISTLAATNLLLGDEKQL